MYSSFQIQTPVSLAMFVTFLVAGVFASPSNAANLVDGGSFDTPSDVAIWGEDFEHRSITWDSQDADGSSGSGSLRLTTSSPIGDSGYTAIRRCFLVTPGLKYRVSAETLIPLGQTNTTRVLMFADYNATSNCSPGHVLEARESNIVSTTGSWQALTMDDFVAPPFARSVQILLGSRKLQDGGSVDVLLDNVAVEEITGACEDTPTTLCLNDNRFSVGIDWLTPQGEQGVGKAVPMTLDSGLFWFFNASNLEVLIKVLDACSFATHYWVYFAATTDVNYRLTVTDTATGAVRQYINPQGERAQATADSEAFPCS